MAAATLSARTNELPRMSRVAYGFGEGLCCCGGVGVRAGRAVDAGDPLGPGVGDGAPGPYSMIRGSAR